MPFRTDRLQQLRQQRNLSQADLAADLELSQNQLYRYEAGESSPKDDALIAMAEYFNTSTDYLLGLSHVAHPEDVPRPDF
ncbi:MAG: helix-turn-helix transcriptional regulator, partial [Chloroflexota bacterium]